MIKSFLVLFAESFAAFAVKGFDRKARKAQRPQRKKTHLT
jgi:hypothetical protein